MFFIRHALRAGFTIEEIFNLTKIDRWFLVQIHCCGLQMSQPIAPHKNPNGIPCHSPRLPRNAATLGQGPRNSSTATRLRPIRSNLTRNLGHNLVEVILILGRSPKAGAAHQPWADWHNSVGVACRRCLLHGHSPSQSAFNLSYRFPFSPRIVQSASRRHAEAALWRAA